MDQIQLMNCYNQMVVYDYSYGKRNSKYMDQKAMNFKMYSSFQYPRTLSAGEYGQQWWELDQIM